MAKADYTGKTVVITGASGGIGAETALAFARRGARLVLSGRDQGRLDQVAEAVRGLGAEAQAITADVTRFEEMQALVAKAIARFGKIDVMMLGAGIGVVGRAENISLELLHKQIDVNFWGVIHGFHAALPHFQRQKSGQFIILNSLAGRIPLPLNAAYCSSKFALWGFFEAARPELKQHHIDLLCVYPGFVKTAFQSRIFSPDYEVPADLAQRMRGEDPKEFAEKIAAAAQKRKGEFIHTVSGNLGARLLPVSHALMIGFTKISLLTVPRLIRPRNLGVRPLR